MDLGDVGGQWEVHLECKTHKVLRDTLVEAKADLQPGDRVTVHWETGRKKFWNAVVATPTSKPPKSPMVPKPSSPKLPKPPSPKVPKPSSSKVPKPSSSKTPPHVKKAKPNCKFCIKLHL